MIAVELRSFQIPLIEFVESDDLYLERQEDVLWFDVLRDLDWRSFRPIAARYYEALWQFNVRQTQTRRERDASQPANPETESDATLRLLFERATLCEDTPALHELPASAPPQIQVDPQGLQVRQGPAAMGRQDTEVLLRLVCGVPWGDAPRPPRRAGDRPRGTPEQSLVCARLRIHAAPA